MRRLRPASCDRATENAGTADAAPINPMNSRRFMSSPRPRKSTIAAQIIIEKELPTSHLSHSRRFGMSASCPVRGNLGSAVHALGWGLTTDYFSSRVPERSAARVLQAGPILLCMGLFSRFCVQALRVHGPHSASKTRVNALIVASNTRVNARRYAVSRTPDRQCSSSRRLRARRAAEHCPAACGRRRKR